MRYPPPTHPADLFVVVPLRRRTSSSSFSSLPQYRERLHMLVTLFQTRLRQLPPGAVLASPSAIQGVVLPGPRAPPRHPTHPSLGLDLTRRVRKENTATRQ